MWSGPGIAGDSGGRVLEKLAAEVPHGERRGERSNGSRTLAEEGSGSIS